MPIFVSYARADAAVVKDLYDDLEQVHSPVWMDSRLSGGQAWWDTILEQIRTCDLFVVALSPDSIRSEACSAELDYALALDRPLLPVLVRDVAIQLAAPAIASTHYVDYRVPSRQAAFELIGAVTKREAAPTLPSPLPVAPPPPMSYMSDFRELVDAPRLSYDQQKHLLLDLRDYYAQGGDRRDLAGQLIRSLRQRGDIAYTIARDIDDLLAEESAGTEPTRPTSAAGPGRPGAGQPSTTQGRGAEPAAPAPGASTDNQAAPSQPAGNAWYAAPATTPHQGAGPVPHSAGSTGTARPPVGGSQHSQPSANPPQPATYSPFGPMGSTTPPPQGQPRPMAQPTPPQQPRPMAQPTPPQQWPTSQPTPPPIAAFAAPTPRTPQAARPGPPPGGARSHPQGTTVLVLGILGLVLCPIVGIFALTTGSKVLKEIDASPGLYRDRGMVVAGRWLGIGGIVLWSVVLVIYLIAVIAASSYSY